MKDLIQNILYFHAFSGGSALIFGIVAIATKKGSKAHINSGNIYFWSMFAVIITGLVVGFYRNNIFLQTIAIFSFYMAFTGKRVLRYKKEIKPQLIDWLVNFIALIGSLFMLYLGIINVLRIGFAGAVPMLLVFGLFLLMMSSEDLRRMWQKKFIKNNWLYTHIGRMGGSFIATSTAFLLVNITFDPAWIMWLLPTAVGTPMIINATKKWRKKMNPIKGT